MGCTDAIQLAREIVTADSTRRFIVVSAPGKACIYSRKVTDLLIEAYTQLCVGGESSSLELVLDRFREMAGHLGVDMEAELERCREEVYIHRCQRDFIVSRGEYLMALMFAKVTGYRFLDAAKFMVIKRNGKIDEVKTAENFRRLDKSQSFVMGGFYGRAAGDGVKTFARGGSDYSGAVVACMLDASLYENFTDTHGVQSANPSIITDTKTVQFLDYNTLYKLSLGGAQVIFPECLPLLKKYNIPLVIDNTFNHGRRFTAVSNDRTHMPFFSITYSGIRAVAEVLIVLNHIKLEYDRLKEILKGFEVYVSMYKRNEIRLITAGEEVEEVVKRLHAYLIL